jgi:hypothetical protein
MDGDVLRVEPVGEDANGNMYFYFGGARLYREGAPSGRAAFFYSVSLCSLALFVISPLAAPAHRRKSKKVKPPDAQELMFGNAEER